MRKLLRDNGLVLFFATIFLLALLGEAIAGFHAFNDDQFAGGAAPVSWTPTSPRPTSARTSRRTGSRNTCSSPSTSSRPCTWSSAAHRSPSRSTEEGTESDQDQRIGAHARPDSPA